MENGARWLAILILGVAVLAPSPVSAQESQIAEGVSLGGRAMYYRPNDADGGTLSGGAQLRIHLSSMLALEGSIDYRQSKFGETVIDVYPVQASLLIYLLPRSRLTPFILGGGGWYYTHVRKPHESTRIASIPRAGTSATTASCSRRA